MVQYSGAGYRTHSRNSLHFSIFRKFSKNIPKNTTKYSRTVTHFDIFCNSPCKYWSKTKIVARN